MWCYGAIIWCYDQIIWYYDHIIWCYDVCIRGYYLECKATMFVCGMHKTVFITTMLLRNTTNLNIWLLCLYVRLLSVYEMLWTDLLTLWSMIELCPCFIFPKELLFEYYCFEILFKPRLRNRTLLQFKTTSNTSFYNTISFDFLTVKKLGET